MTPLSAAARAAVLAFALSSAAAVPSAAQSIVADDGQVIAESLRQSGYRAEIERIENGRLRIRTGSDGLNFFVFLRDCEEYRNCRNVSLHAGFTMETPPTLDRINEWNRSRIVGQAFLDTAGQPRLSHFVTMRGGVSAEAFNDALRFFREALRDYATHIGFRR